LIGGFHNQARIPFSSATLCLDYIEKTWLTLRFHFITKSTARQLLNDYLILVSETKIKQQLIIACLETLRLFEKIRDSAESKIVINRIDSRINELNGILNQLDNEIGIDVLKSLASRITQMHQEIIDGTKS
jgi:hypothetical protein